MNEKMANALNEQMNFEIYSAYIYLAMSSYLRTLNLNGFAHWMEVQMQEELDHARRFYTFIHDRGGEVEFTEIPKPQKAWESVEDVFKHALEHEQLVTSKINNLVEMANQEKDFATNAHLQWFVNEQVEEEAQTNEILAQVRFSKNSPNAILLLDKDLAQRTYTPAQDSGQQQGQQNA